MAEKWELCITGPNLMEFYKPGMTVQTFSCKDYIESMGGKPGLTTNYKDIIPYLLDDGWEPYAASDGVKYFRRKVNI